MSQHEYISTYQGRPVRVLMGWDRPLQGFFMVIDETQNLSDEYVYSNLEEEVPHPKSLEPFIQKLQELGIPVPEKMLQAVEEDGEKNEGNNYKQWVDA